MKKQVSILFATIVATLPLANMAHAEGLYFKGLIGKSYPNEKTVTDAGEKFKLKKHKDKLVYNLGAGLQFTPEMAVEIDLRRRNYTIDSRLFNGGLDAQADTAMLNGVYQLNAGALKPYVKAGLGVARHKLDESFDDGDDEDTTDKFAWNIGTGINYYLVSNMAVNLDYQYQSLGKDKKTKFDMTGHEVVAGLRFDF